MCPRQIHFAFDSAKWSITPTGCGSWTIDEVVVVGSSSRAFSSW